MVYARAMSSSWNVPNQPVYRQPAELGPPPPRAPSPRAREIIFAYQGSQRIRLTIGLAFIVVGLIVGLSFGSSAFVDIALDVSAVPCQAEILSSELLRNVRINKKSPTEIRFRCTVNGQTVESSSATLQSAIIAQAVPGARMEAEVSPSLSMGRLKGTTYSTMGYMGLAPFLFPVFGVVFTLLAFLSNRREIRAFVHGRAVRGRVVRRGEDRSARQNKKHPWLVEWQFEVAGQVYQGSLSHMNKALLQSAFPSDDIIVLYDPQNPKVNTALVE